MRNRLTAGLLLLLPTYLQAAPLQVAASFGIPADAVRAVGGDRVQVQSIVPAGAELHHYVPKPSDVAAISKADLTVINGLGAENSMTGLLSNARKLVTASDGITPIINNGEPDPHVWHNPQNMRLYVKNIAEALSKADPEGRDYYNSRAADYSRQLQDLDVQLLNIINRLPTERRTAVTSHDAMAYLAKHYNIRLLPLDDAFGNEASPRKRSAVLKAAAEQGARAVFFEDNRTARVAAQIAADARLKIGGTLYADSLSSPGGPAPDYLTMMRYNINAIVMALQ